MVHSYRLGGTFAVIERDDGAPVPIDLGNKNFVTFLAEWRAGASVTDSRGLAVPYSEASVRSVTAPPPPWPRPRS